MPTPEESVISWGSAYSDIWDINIVDADQHVTEAPDLFEKWLPKKLQDRAPQRVKMPSGSDGWSFDGGKRVIAIPPSSSAPGLTPLDFHNDAIITYETMRPGCYDGKARLTDMTLDGIHAAVIFSTMFLGGATAISEDPEVSKACVRAYNDWLVDDFCAADPKRLFAMAQAPVSGVDDLIAECERSMKKGHKAIVLKRWPNGGQGPQPEDDKFWAYAENSGLPIALHFGADFGPTVLTLLAGGGTGGRGIVALGTANKCGVSSALVLDAFMGMAIAEKFPRIKIGLIEANIGWIPCYLEQADDRWMRYRWWTRKTHLELAPSQVWHRNYWASFICDRVGVELRHHTGVDRIMWTTDYPHGGNEWPNSRMTIDRLFRGVPANERRMILSENAINFYNLPISATRADIGPANGRSAALAAAGRNGHDATS